MPTNTRSPSPLVGIAQTVLASVLTACTFVDDDPRIPFEPSETEDDSAGSDECLPAVEQAQSTCEPPQQLVLMGKGVSMILFDDLLASIQVAPSGWLVQMPSASYFVGSEYFGDGRCTVGCGWCQPGQSLCHSGLDENGQSGCTLCMPWDTPDAEEQCAQLVESCGGADDGDDTDSGDAGSDEPPDEPLPDENSSGGSSGSSDTDSGSTGPGGTDSGSTGPGEDGSERGLDETGS